MLELDEQAALRLRSGRRPRGAFGTGAQVSMSGDDGVGPGTAGRLHAPVYDWSADLPRLTMPVMLIYGDSDTFRLEHIMKFYQLLGGGQGDAGWQREHMPKNRLAILPNLTHCELGVAPQMVDAALRFLEAERSAQSWNGQVGAK